MIIMFFCRCEDYTISLLEQCEDLREVSSLPHIWQQQNHRCQPSKNSRIINVLLFVRWKHSCKLGILETRTPTTCWPFSIQGKTLYLSSQNLLETRLPISLHFMTYSRMKFVAHERFQYVLLKKFGEWSILFSIFSFFDISN